MRWFVRGLPFALVVLTGCATLESRVAKNQALLQTYPADIRHKIEGGEIARGFTKPMVQIAWGDPDDTFRREDSGGESETWVYRGYRSRYAMSYAPVGGFWAGGHHRRHVFVPYGFAPYDVTWREDYTRATVTFRGGRVIAYEVKQR
ncbi:MAG TPA: hypothetical protein PLU30_03790 [Verrucomicrobiae bacterium]|nr:hypothetical protein [Verrucomicrobiae bacterium]